MKQAKLVDKIEIWPVGQLIAYVKNPRIHSKTQIAQIKASIRSYGMINPILVDLQGNVIAGHGRILAGQQLGLTHLPVIVLDHLTEAEVRQLRIADNRITENGRWDESLLSAELAAILEAQIDLTLLGFSELELKDLLAGLETESGRIGDDEVPEPPPNLITRAGDEWIMGEHRIRCGDSTVIETVQQVLERSAADLIFVDLPYNVRYLGSPRASAARASRPILNDDLGKDFGKFLYDSCVVMLAVCGGAIYICMSSSELHTLHKAFTDAGGHWSTYVIWAKNTFTLGRSDLQRQWEPMLYGWKEGSTHYWSGARNVGDVWFVDKPHKNDLHPTMKPVELVEKAILLSSRKGDLVLDPFAGSGSTLIACHKNGRRARLIELDPHYVDVTISRWQSFTGEAARLASNGCTFEEVAEQRTGSDPNGGGTQS
jgi:DNA modification methylase